MVTVGSIYLRFYIEVGVGVGTFLPTPTSTPPKIPSDSAALSSMVGVCEEGHRQYFEKVPKVSN
jgi:hypothetical protein